MKSSASQWRVGVVMAPFLCGLLHAQQLEPNEQAKRLADGPFRWIKINGATTQAKPEAAKKPKAAKSIESGNPIENATDLAQPAPVARDQVPDKAPGKVEERKEAGAEALPQPISASRADPAHVSVESAVQPRREPAPLRLVNRVLPEPPDHLISEDADDRVLVQFMVLADGSVTDTRIVSSTNPRLNGHALKAVAQWRYAAIEGSRVAQAAFQFRR